MYMTMRYALKRCAVHHSSECCMGCMWCVGYIYDNALDWVVSYRHTAMHISHTPLTPVVYCNEPLHYSSEWYMEYTYGNVYIWHRSSECCMGRVGYALYLSLRLQLRSVGGHNVSGLCIIPPNAAQSKSQKSNFVPAAPKPSTVNPKPSKFLNLHPKP